MTKPAAIQSEKLALKLAEIRNLEVPKLAEQLQRQPRLTELLWFVQWKSTQPGGLFKFAAELVKQFPERFTTKTLAGAKGSKLSYQEKRAIFNELPDPVANEVYPRAENFGAEHLLDKSPVSHVHAEAGIQSALRNWERDQFSAALGQYAVRMLPSYLAALCQDLHADFSGETEYCADAVALVFEAMALQGRNATERLAKTAVTDKVFDALEYAFSERCMVRIEGDSRFGKTESIRAWCESRPGLARLVNVPSSNTLCDLLRKVADALGIPWTYNTTQAELKIKVEFVIKHSGLFIVLDEGAFLLPQTYNRNTSPARLNWVRTEIVDRGLPLALVVTPQTFGPAVERFVRATKYAMEQFIGRTLYTAQLPCELAIGDLKAVAAVHFPELSDDALTFVAGAAMVSDNYLMAVEAIAKRARFIARREKRPSVTTADLDLAVSEVIPSAPALRAAVETSPAKVTHPRQRKAIENPFKAPGRAMETPLRSPRITRESDPVFERRSLRGAGLERTEAELIPA